VFSSPWNPFVQGVCARETLPNFEKLCDDFIQEETRLEMISAKVKEIQNLALIQNVRRGGNNGGPERGKEEGSGSSKQGKKDLSHSAAR
jgi:hypothetical protein